MKARKKSKKKKKGFTLTELLAVIAILAIIMGIGIATFVNIRDSVLKKEYENVVTQLEGEASRFAEDTSITTVSVERLIEEGYIIPDDETDIYNPQNNESLNCYVIYSHYENGGYTSKFGENMGRDENGKCNPYEETVDLQVCKYNADMTECESISQGEWFKDDVTLGLKYHGDEVLQDDTIRYDWLGSDGSTSNSYYLTTNTNLINQITYRVRVTFSDNKVSETNQAINIDKQAPVVVEAVLDPEEVVWAKEKTLDVLASDYSGSGVAGIYIGPEKTCTETLEYDYNLTDATSIKKAIGAGENNVCVIDKVGNVSEEGYIVSNNHLDNTGADWIELESSNPDGYVQSVDLIGSAQDTLSGLVAYQFSASAKPDENSWIEINNTNEEVRYTNPVDENGVYYFHVKDLVGNTSSAEYEVKNIDKQIDSMSISKSTSSYVTSLNLNLSATDNGSGIVRYQVTTSSSRPTSGWTNVSNRRSLSATYPVSDNRTYYFWVEDAAGNADYRSITINNIVVQATTSTTVRSESRNTISSSLNISNIVQLINVTSNKGRVSSKSLSGNRVYFTVTGGSSSTGYRTGTCYRKANTYAAYSRCNSYYCPNGGKVSGSWCVAGCSSGTSSYCRYTNPHDGRSVKCEYKNSSKTMCKLTGYNYFTCVNGKWRETGNTSTDCPEHYSMYGNYWCLPSISGQTCSGGSTTVDCYKNCQWMGNYNATCRSYSSARCDSGDYKSGSTCYYCSTGTLNTSSKTCRYSCQTSYTYWQYSVTITYYRLK